MTTTTRKVSNWQKLSGAFLVWEGAAAITEAGNSHGIFTRKIPYVTDIIRPLPKPIRMAVTGVIVAIVWDHFCEDGKRRWF